MEFDDFDLTVERAIRPATQRVLSMNMFNEPPPGGTDYVLVWFSLDCKRSGTDLCGGGDFGVRLVDEDGEEWGRDGVSSITVVTDFIDDLETIGGASIEGWKLFAFPQNKSVQAIKITAGGSIFGGGDSVYAAFP